MKLFNKILTGMMSLMCISLNASLFLSDSQVPVTEYDRIIVISKQNYPYTGTNPTDPQHAFMKSTGIFTQAEIDQLQYDTAIDFLAQYGIDLNPLTNPLVQVDPLTGIRSLPGVAVMIPGVFGNVPGQPWVVTTDTKNPDREFKWLQYQFPYLVRFLAPYTVPQGFAQEGAQVKAGSLFFRAYFVQCKIGCDPSIEENREIFDTSCRILSNTSANMWGLAEFYFPYDIKDRAQIPNHGFVTSATVEVREPGDFTGLQRLQGRHVYTFKNCSNIDDAY